MPHQRKRSTFTDRSTTTFSLDAHVRSLAPPGAEIELIHGRGTLGGDFNNGDLLAVAKGDCYGSADAHWIVRVGETYFVRPRGEVEAWRRRLNMYVVGSKTATNVEIVGMIICRLRSFVGVAVVAVAVHLSY